MTHRRKISRPGPLEPGQTPRAGVEDLRSPGLRVTAQRVDALTLTVPGGAITASTMSRTLAGPLVRYGVPGRTSAGRLKVARGALQWPADLGDVKLTREHNRDESRGHLTSVQDDGQTVRVSARVADGPDGDAALREASDRTRDGFSFDIVDAVIQGDTITAGVVVAVGQVGIPAFDGMRIDTIAAAAATPSSSPAGSSAGGPSTEGTPMPLTPEQIARLTALLGQESLTAEESAELAQLLAAAQPDQAQASAAQTAPAAAASPSAPTAGATPPAAVSASIPAVPGSVPRPAARTAPSGDALAAFTRMVVQALAPGGGGSQAITAALSDITHAGAGANIEAPAWSGELWSGLEYEPEFTPLLASGDLTSYEGHGWRFVQKPEMQDYAGNKAAIPSGPVTTEPSSYEAARMAVGHDIDRKFYDFPNEAFLRAYAEACRESWAIKLDAKVEDYITTAAVPVTTADGADPDTDPDLVGAPSLLKAVAIAGRQLKRTKVGRPTFVVVNADDMLDLFDVTEQNRPAFLDLFKIDPANWVASDQVAPGTVTVGVRQAATVRTLPGSPIRVDAQHLANGGIDSAFFGYWAVEEHHTSGIVSVQYDPAL